MSPKCRAPYGSGVLIPAIVEAGRAVLELFVLAKDLFYKAAYLAGKAARDGGITILSYHSIDEHGTPLSVSPPLFASQIETLMTEGCVSFTMREVAATLARRALFPPRAVAITFDDGFENVLTHAGPLLRRYGLNATIFPITGMLGETTAWTDGDFRLPPLRVMDWAQLERLHHEGWEIGGHSLTHGFLTQYGDAQLQDELQRPAEEIRTRLGVPVVSFAYPQGDYDIRVVRAVRATGYTSAVTVDQGRARLHSDPLRLPRLLVSNNTSPSTMRAFLSPGIGPAYRLLNMVMKRLKRNPNWPRRKPGEVDSTLVQPN